MHTVLQTIMAAVSVGKNLSVPDVCKNEPQFERRRITPASVLASTFSRKCQQRLTVSVFPKFVRYVTFLLGFSTAYYSRCHLGPHTSVHDSRICTDIRIGLRDVFVFGMEYIGVWYNLKPHLEHFFVRAICNFKYFAGK
jgi:hypothetical protein